ncbi:hypothetical protein ACR79N_08655 [Sphingobacterium siyangense]|uniref:hypothetical protein n=1 Tax=Sphingobacterium siyangense TaxID=459529 RepID=UPI003DA66101
MINTDSFLLVRWNTTIMYTYTMTQEVVDACRRAIKNMNLPKPKADLTALRD